MDEYNFPKVLPKLPQKLTIGERFASASRSRLLFFGFGLYFFVICLALTIQSEVIDSGLQVVENHKSVSVTDPLELTYFNFVTVLTIGYGDYTPVGFWGRLVAIMESIAGIFILGCLVSIIVLKAVSSRKDTLVFGKYFYFDKETGRFIIVFLKTTKTNLVNTDICSVIKVDRKMQTISPSFRAPYIGDTPWSFSINHIDEITSYLERNSGYEYNGQKPLQGLKIYENDGIKVGFSGYIGFALHSTYARYRFSDCIVIERKTDLPITQENFENLSKDEKNNAFHFLPENAQTFLEWANSLGAEIQPPARAARQPTQTPLLKREF